MRRHRGPVVGEPGDARAPGYGPRDLGCASPRRRPRHLGHASPPSRPRRPRCANPPARPSASVPWSTPPPGTSGERGLLVRTSGEGWRRGRTAPGCGLCSPWCGLLVRPCAGLCEPGPGRRAGSRFGRGHPDQDPAHPCLVAHPATVRPGPPRTRPSQAYGSSPGPAARRVPPAAPRRSRAARAPRPLPRRPDPVRRGPRRLPGPSARRIGCGRLTPARGVVPVRWPHAVRRRGGRAMRTAHGRDTDRRGGRAQRSGGRWCGPRARRRDAVGAPAARLRG